MTQSGRSPYLNSFHLETMRTTQLIHFRLVLLVLAASFLYGCFDMWYGFYRSSNPTPAVIRFNCVEDNVRMIPDIQDLDYRTEVGGRDITWSGVKPANTIHRYTFKHHEQSMYFLFDEGWDGKVSYRAVASLTQKEGMAELVELAKPLFVKIESVIQECGFDNLDQVVRGD